MRTALSAALLLAFASPPAEALEAQLSQNARALRDFVINTYLEKQFLSHRERVHEELEKPDPSCPALELVADTHLYAETWDPDRRRSSFENHDWAVCWAGPKLARLYGYAVGNQRIKEKTGTARARFLTQLEKNVIPELLQGIAAEMARIRPDGLSAEEHFKKLSREFDLSVGGECEREMEKLTGVPASSAPDMIRALTESARGQRPSPRPSPPPAKEPKSSPSGDKYIVTISPQRQLEVEKAKPVPLRDPYLGKNAYQLLVNQDGREITLWLVHARQVCQMNGGNLIGAEAVLNGKRWRSRGTFSGCLYKWDDCLRAAESYKAQMEKKRWKP